jgi:hypothetical protein
LSEMRQRGMGPPPGGAPVSSAERWWGQPCTRGVNLGLCRVVLTTAGEWGCRKAKAGPAGKLSKAILGMLRTDRSCGGVNSHPGARGQTGWRLPMIWTEAGVLVPQPAWHRGHSGLAQGTRDEGGDGRGASPGRGRDGYGALRGLWPAPALALERMPRATCGLLAPVRETGAPAGGAGLWVCSGLRARPPQGDQKLLRQTIITPFD